MSQTANSTITHRSAWSLALRRLFRDKTATVGLITVLALLFVAIAAPWIAPYDPREQNVLARMKPPSEEHRLGTDEFGRDVLSRIVWGSRASLTVGILAVLLAMAIGVTLGVSAGYMSGTYELIVMRLMDGFLAFPSLLMGMLIVAVLGTGLTNTIIAIAISLVPQFARLARSAVLAVKELEYVQSARAIGLGHLGIILKYVLPNISGPLIIMATLWIGTAIRMEASLSFLGLGVQPPTPSWGTMIKTGVDRITRAPWLAIYPSVAIMLSVFAFNLFGDGVRDMLDPEARKTG